MKGNKNYENYIGRYFKRKTNFEHIVFKILGFDGRYFRAENYYLTLGSSTKEINCRYQVSFLDDDNFEEITEEEFLSVVSLCDRPYVAIFDENDVPTYL